MNSTLARLLFVAILVSPSVSANDEMGVSVSFINLIATPEKYTGKLVYITGYLSLKFENMTICQTKYSLSSHDCLWLSIDPGPYETYADMHRYDAARRKWQKFNHKMVSIRGIFDVAVTGHGGMYPGGIKDVRNVYAKNLYANMVK